MDINKDYKLIIMDENESKALLFKDTSCSPYKVTVKGELRNKIGEIGIEFLNILIKIDCSTDNDKIKNSQVYELLHNEKYKLIIKEKEIISFYYWCTNLTLSNLKVININVNIIDISSFTNTKTVIMKKCKDCDEKFFITPKNRTELRTKCIFIELCPNCENKRIKESNKKREEQERLGKEKEELKVKVITDKINKVKNISSNILVIKDKDTYKIGFENEDVKKYINNDFINLIDEALEINNKFNYKPGIPDYKTGTLKFEQILKNKKYEELIYSPLFYNILKWFTCYSFSNINKFLNMPEILPNEITDIGLIMIDKNIHTNKLIYEKPKTRGSDNCKKYYDFKEWLKKLYFSSEHIKYNILFCDNINEILNKLDGNNKNQIKEDINKLKTMPYEKYLQTEHWKATRKKALKKANYKCEVCNSIEELNVHHKTYEHRGEEPPEDLIVLCHHCHAKFHDKLDDEVKSNNSIDNNDTQLLNKILNVLHIDKDELQQYITYKNKINQFEQKVQNNFINNKINNIITTI